MLPSPMEVEQCLQDAAKRHQMESHRLHAERANAGDENDAAQELCRLIIEELRRIEPLRGEVRRTVLIADAETSEQEAFALVSHGGGQCVSFLGEEVQMVSIETSAGQAMLRCSAGDILLLGRVLAVDDSPTESAEIKRLMQTASAAHAVQCRQTRLDKKERLAAEREEARCLEQEAFERRAEAHFQRADAIPDAAPKQTEKEKQTSAAAQQLRWPL